MELENDPITFFSLPLGIFMMYCILKLIYKIKQRGVSVLLVEHDMDLVMDISQEVVVIDSGMVIAEGTPKEIQNNEEVIATYLGE